jgi:hypothetical protein
MANEHLTRTPTSTGNRRAFTISFWTKNNVAGGHYFQQRENANSTTQFGISHRTPEDYLRVIMNDGGDVESLSDCLAEMRDFSSWQNIIVAVNTTIVLAEDRVKIYVDGVRRTDFASDSHPDNPAQNFLTSVNDTVRALIGLQRPNSSATLNNSVTAQLTDYFLIDGQALTPDVFGFYKNGDGYISVGSPQAIDFRPGQWVPKAPRTIKSEINRKGGFGVNGFYMPMNDSSNFGADFHCDPNTIIKLKGEDLPQPRNGAPTTTDSYVSQLRTDANASNLVLAIPGITGGQGSGYGDYSADIKGSGSNKTITANGNAGVAVTASYYGSAMQFDGTGDYFSVPNSSDLRFTSEDFTIEAWFNTNSLSDDQFIFSQWNVTNNRRSYVLWLDSGVLKFNGSTDGSDSSNGNVTNTISVGANQWNHAAFTREGTTTRLFLNGACVGVGTNTQNFYNNTDDTPRIGGESGTGTREFDGYIQDLRVYKGVAKYTGGFDVSKPYAPVGIGTWRQVPDTCKNNFATLNPDFGVGRVDQQTFSNGSLRVVSSATSGSDTTAPSTMAIKGKIYCEFALTDDGLGAYVGVMKYNTALTNNGVDTTASSDCWLIRGDNEHKANGDGGSGADYGTGTWSTGDIIMMAVDIDNTSIWFGKNGTWYASGDPAANSNAAYTNLPSTDDLLTICGDNYSSETPTIDVNFGQNPTFGGTKTAGTNTDANGRGLFAYAVPTGFLAMCEDNLPTPAIADPGEHFKCVLWTGDGSVGRSITGVGFKPDLVWIKSRSFANNHHLFDVIRGPNRILRSSTTDAESSPGNVMPSFNDDGFTVGEDGSNNATNDAGNTFVAWCWKAGGESVTNNVGTIESQVSTNQTAGFSIVSYTGNGTSGTVGHGLGKTPNIVIVKNRIDVSNWSFNGNIGGLVYGTNKMVLQGTGAIVSDTNEVTSANATTFTLGNSTATNGVADAQIAYCWTEIEGFSKFGSYTGTGDADGPFVYCGFKPAWVMAKNADDTGGRDWGIQDSSRKSTNPCDKHLKANADEVENSGLADSTYQIDLLSNGFKVSNNTGIWNNDGETIIFMAFAESPFQTANAK